MALNSYAPNTVIKSAEENANWTNFSGHGRWAVLAWGFSGTLIIDVPSKFYFMLPDDATWERADIIVDTAPTGANLIVDIERSTDNGGTWVTIFTTQGNRPTITAGSRTGNTTTIDVPGATGNNHLFRAVVEQVGSTVGGADLTVLLKGKYDLD